MDSGKDCTSSIWYETNESLKEIMQSVQCYLGKNSIKVKYDERLSPEWTSLDGRLEISLFEIRGEGYTVIVSEDTSENTTEEEE